MRRRGSCFGDAAGTTLTVGIGARLSAVADSAGSREMWYRARHRPRCDLGLAAESEGTAATRSEGSSRGSRRGQAARGLRCGRTFSTGWSLTVMLKKHTEASVLVEYICTVIVVLLLGSAARMPS